MKYAVPSIALSVFLATGCIIRIDSPPNENPSLPDVLDGGAGGNDGTDGGNEECISYADCPVPNPLPMCRFPSCVNGTCGVEKSIDGSPCFDDVNNAGKCINGQCEMNLDPCRWHPNGEVCTVVIDGVYGSCQNEHCVSACQLSSDCDGAAVQSSQCFVAECIEGRCLADRAPDDWTCSMTGKPGECKSGLCILFP
jgi:hypothetical protein